MKLGFKWHLAISKNKSEDNSDIVKMFQTAKFKAIECKEGVFQADPFLFKYGGENFVFYEECNYKKGVIKCSLVDTSNEIKLTDTYTSFELNSHLSFPNIFKDNLTGETYMIPESSKAGKIIILRLKQFPNDWEIVNEMPLAGKDTSYFLNNGKTYLLTTVGNNNNVTIIEMESLLSKPKIVFSKDIIEFKSKRNAGKIRKINEKYIRPTQFDVNDYGENIHFNSFEICKKDGSYNFKESTFKDFKCSNLKSGIAGMHHFDFNEDLIVTDINIKINYDQSRYW